MRIYKATDRAGRTPYVITTSTHYVIVNGGESVLFVPDEALELFFQFL